MNKSFEVVVVMGVTLKTSKYLTKFRSPKQNDQQTQMF